MNVAPYRVSGRVVNTRISEVSERLFVSSRKLTSAPIDFPIQFLCMIFTGSGQSSSSLSNNSSA